MFTVKNGFSLLFILVLSTISQINLLHAIEFTSENIISTSQDAAYDLKAVDFDNDGDMDIVSSAFLETTLTYFENIDGQGTFAEGVTIPTNETYIEGFDLGDLDGDGDLDIAISAPSVDWGRVCWYENIGGSTFINQEPNVLLDTQADPMSMWIADLDNDGDNDMLATTWLNGELIWFENTDGSGTFSAKKVLDSNTQGMNYASAYDINNDGTLNPISISYQKISWYEILPGGTVTEHIVINDEQYLSYGETVKVADMNGDGFLDIVATGKGYWEVMWFENIDGTGNFGDKIVISDDLAIPEALVLADLDNDGDIEIITAPAATTTIVIYENLDGLGNFSEEIIIDNNSDGTNNIVSADFDGDGLLDIAQASIQDDKVSWFRNTTSVGIAENYELSIMNYELKQNYPNPFNPVTEINYELGITNYELAEIVVYNAMGEEVWSSGNLPFTIHHSSLFFDGSKFNSGIYNYSLVIDGRKMDTKSMVLIK